MEVESDFESLCERYLLGELPETDSQALEEAYFADDSLFERFLAVKDELIDAYSRGDLAADKRKHFEQNFLVGEERRQRVAETSEFIRTVTRHAENVSARRSTPRIPVQEWLATHITFRPFVWRIVFAVFLLAALAVGWIVIRQRKAQRSIEESAQQIPTPAPTVTTTQSPLPSPTAKIENVIPTPTPQPQLAVKPSPEASSAQVASLLLLPVSSREIGTSNTLSLGPVARVVRLSLVFSGSTDSTFEVSLQAVDGQRVVHRKNLRSTSNGDGNRVTVTFDSSLLRRQDYIATLKARGAKGKLDTVGDYYFRVERSSKSDGFPPKD